MSLSKEQNSEQSGINNNSNVDARGSDVELNVAPSTSSIVENQSQPKEDSEANELVVNEDSVILESTKGTTRWSSCLGFLQKSQSSSRSLVYGSGKFKHPLNLVPGVMSRQTLTQPMIFVVALLLTK